VTNSCPEWNLNSCRCSSGGIDYTVLDDSYEFAILRSTNQKYCIIIILCWTMTHRNNWNIVHDLYSKPYREIFCCQIWHRWHLQCNNFESNSSHFRLTRYPDTQKYAIVKCTTISRNPHHHNLIVRAHIIGTIWIMHTSIFEINSMNWSKLWIFPLALSKNLLGILPESLICCSSPWGNI